MSPDDLNNLESRISAVEATLKGESISQSVVNKGAVFNGQFHLVNRTALPSVCDIGDMAIVNGVEYVCSASNTWSSFRSLLSGTSPISYDSSTGIISFNGLSQIKESFTAGENVTIGNALSVGPYQSDSGITFDAKDVSATTAAANSKTVSFTVGNNSNRGLFLYVMSSSTNGVTATYNGTSMTSAFTGFTVVSQYLYGFYLAAPTVGTHNLVINGLNGTEQFAYGLYSYYNVDQTTPAAAASTTTAAASSSVSQAVTPLNNASLLLSSVLVNSSSSGWTQTNMNNNAVELDTVAANFAFITGDSFLLANQLPVTVSSSKSGSLSYAMATLEIKAATAPSYRIFKSNTTTTGYNTNWKLTSYIGIAEATIALGSSVSTLLAGTDTNQSGLLPSTQYYIGASGAFATSGTRKAGIAVSATEILITNVW